MLAALPNTLASLEAVIEKGLTTFMEVGAALREIRDQRLYKSEYKSFEQYCRERWGWSRRHANYQIAAVNLVDNLGTMVPKPENERQARALYMSETSEWYTPPAIIERVAAVLGTIDLDPCSNEGKSVPAETCLTAEDDGLSQRWAGTVYMNPPYGREIVPWAEKLCDEYARGNVSEAIALVPARVDTEWFRLFRDFPICFLDGRLKFSGHENSAPFPSAVIYLGKDIDKFDTAFGDIGDVWIRWRHAKSST